MSANDDRTGSTTRLARLACCCIAAAAIWACGPVYIPVPPPSAATQVTFTAELVTTDPPGSQRLLWTTVGAPHSPAKNATYYVFDRERNGGVIAKAAADGSYEAPPMEGTEGDHVTIQYLDEDGDNSDVACVILSEARDFAALCPP